MELTIQCLNTDSAQQKRTRKHQTAGRSGARNPANNNKQTISTWQENNIKTKQKNRETKNNTKEHA